MLVPCHNIIRHGLTRCREHLRLVKRRPVACLICRHQHEEASQSSHPVIFSGIQPTGIPHLGNYLGALRQWVELQDTASSNTKLLFSIVDLHAITIPQDAKRLKQWKRQTLAILLAVGLNPERSILFYQSSVPAHAELMWILSCTSSMGYLSRMTQWKVGNCRETLPSPLNTLLTLFQSKLQLTHDTLPLSTGSRSRLKLGLFSYPVLQAADILVHRATHVPVGEDQSQHLEFARECATNFNHTYGNHLNPPATITSTAKRVMSLQEPHLKMSKSHQDSRSRIMLTDNPDEITRKIMAALTDSVNSVSYDPVLRPGVSNLLQLLSYFSEDQKSPEELGEIYAGLGLGEFKALVSRTVAGALESIRARYTEVIAEDDGRYLDFVEAKGAERARANAEMTMTIVRNAIGF